MNIIVVTEDGKPAGAFSHHAAATAFIARHASLAWPRRQFRVFELSLDEPELTDEQLADVIDAKLANGEWPRDLIKERIRRALEPSMASLYASHLALRPEPGEKIRNFP